jgi:hypothetical protein
MKKSIHIGRLSPQLDENAQSYKTVLLASAAVGMTAKIFVMQRAHNYAKETVEDTFAAVATPTQLEDFNEDAPADGSSYFRTDTIELVARTPEQLQSVFNSITFEVSSLIKDLESLEELTELTTWKLTAEGAELE